MDTIGNPACNVFLLRIQVKYGIGEFQYEENFLRGIIYSFVFLVGGPGLGGNK